MNLTHRQAGRLSKRVSQVLTIGANFGNHALNVALLAPSRFKQALNDTSAKSKCSTFDIIWDTGASVCVTPDRDDFLDYSIASDIKSVKGVGGASACVKGQGNVLWKVIDAQGTLRSLKLKAYHIPKSSARLLSTHVLLSTYKGEKISVDEASLTLSGAPGDPSRGSVLAVNCSVSRLPTTTGYKYDNTPASASSVFHSVSTVHDDNKNLSEAQKELLRWHQRLGHLSFAKIQHLMRTGVLSHTEASRHLHTAASKIKSPPKCAACLFGKQTVRSSPGKTSSIIKDRAGVLKAGDLYPGSKVSVDHFISSVKGRLFSGFNRGQSDDDRYSGGCIFVDHASGFIHVEFQSSLSSHDTLKAKLEFERICRDVGVVVQTYMSDNGTAFTSRDFSEHLSSYHQISQFAGVGAHHHNAQAERSIRTIMSIARTMMLHAGIHWPDVASPPLWPMAVHHACFLWNHVPDPSTGLSPSDVFTRTRWPQQKFQDLHVWGCPVYVLDKSIQDGKKIPKWRPRSDRSVYMGTSPRHSSSVPLVLNVGTGSITPQFHVVFDDWFATVSATSEEAPDFTSDDWYKMFGDSRFQYILDSEEAYDDTISQSDIDDHDHFVKRSKLVNDAQNVAQPSRGLDVPEPPSDVLLDPSLPLRNTLPHSLDSSVPSVVPRREETEETKETKADDSSNKHKESRSDSVPIKPSVSPRRSNRLESSRRSTRASKPAPRFTYTHDKRSLTHDANVTIPQLSSANSTMAYHRFVQDPHDVNVCYWFPSQEDVPTIYHVDILDDLATHVLTANSNSDPDLLTYDEAMASPQRNEWIKAAINEITSLEKMNCWEEVPIEAATTQVLPGTWVFKVKRAPDGSFKKFKGRYCIRGDLQKGDFETYAPVVSLSSVRLFVAWSLMLNWYTCTIDFSNAFIQAKLEAPTYIHLPRGYRSSIGRKSCLRLKRSIYGLSVAPRLWYKHVMKALESLGLIPSAHDPCLLFRNDLIVISYVDDLGIQSPSKQVVDEFIAALEKKGFELTREGSFSEYLGIQYESCDDGSISMTQSGLVEKILEATSMQDCNPNKTPTTKEALAIDPDGEDMNETWSYRSVVGMLLYLSTNTRPDIAYAVSQVARFSHHPKQSHASAVKTIVRYLSATSTKGIIFTRPKKLQLECYVDADFSGLYGRDPSEEDTSAKSRSGFIISMGGCYLLCKSQLQSTIALSTSEAEYGALSQAMRTLLPIREMIMELVQSVNVVDDKGAEVFGARDQVMQFDTTVYEDNAAALSLAIKQKVTSRTKHWNVKFHFFWHHVNDDSKRIVVIKVDTKNQKADYLTKGLTRELYENCRRLNQGW